MLLRHCCWCGRGLSKNDATCRAAWRDTATHPVWINLYFLKMWRTVYSGRSDQQILCAHLVHYFVRVQLLSPKTDAPTITLGPACSIDLLSTFIKLHVPIKHNTGMESSLQIAGGNFIRTGCKLKANNYNLKAYYCYYFWKLLCRCPIW